MRRTVLALLLFAAGLALQLGNSPLVAQEPAGTSVACEPVSFTTQEDHRNMMEQLGITKLRPGPSGSATAANPANYDESLANPYPNLPEALRLDRLVMRVREEGIREVILATNPSMEGEVTATYIQQLLAGMGVRVTRLARGLPMGGDLEYVDGVTLAHALVARQEVT